MSLFGGLGSTGGAQSFATFNNSRVEVSTNLGYVNANDNITATANFSGSNPVTFNPSSLDIIYQISAGGGGAMGACYSAMIIYRL